MFSCKKIQSTPHVRFPVVRVCVKNLNQSVLYGCNAILTKKSAIGLIFDVTAVKFKKVGNKVAFSV
jgi:hypothetical protein